ncbi:hypothetical protein PV08_02247 [Exophiala spinifera]|uniref:Uncharacterized protein n=1 Tax=Exophiala spinifera TaxID=91928 RepID=A0A0D2AA77_9EURO|nr:uncharacterized protein PV08_02247 [Exophiala spinifera]KIW21667.1 hypothetical protein PV08_02247 [Exophiala spinifera]
MKGFLSLFSLILVVAADISLQTFIDDNCGADGSTAIQDVHANGKDTVDSSGCELQGQFNSVNIVSVDPGFKCNIYSDTACQNFIMSTEIVACTPVIGQGVSCFNQATFDNPFIESTSDVAIGALTVQVVGGDSLQNQINNAVNQACTSGSACDPTNTLVLSQTFGPGNPACNEGLQDIDPKACSSETCTTTISMSGSFDDNNQRDYMKAVIQKALNNTPALVSFVAVQVVDKNKALQASMTVSTASQCTTIRPPPDFQCSDTLKDLVSGALGLVPDVGGVASLSFQVACDASKGG